jgi:hypothetical protein
VIKNSALSIESARLETSLKKYENGFATDNRDGRMRDGRECATEERVESEPVVSPKNFGRVTDFLADGATCCVTI